MEDVASAAKNDIKPGDRVRDLHKGVEGKVLACHDKWCWITTDGGAPWSAPERDLVKVPTFPHRFITVYPDRFGSSFVSFSDARIRAPRHILGIIELHEDGTTTMHPATDGGAS